MKIFSKEQIYEGDRLTTERQNMSSTDLMERAGNQIFNWMHLRMQGAQVPIHIFCGIGNNGGDGLVLARHLITHGYNVIINGKKERYSNPTNGKGFTYEIEECTRCISEGQIQSNAWSHQDSLNLIKITDTIRKKTGMTYPFE